MEKIYDMIVDWTRDEEAKYQAGLVAKEVDRFRSESVEKEQATVVSSRPSSKSSKKGSPGPTDKKKPKSKKNFKNLRHFFSSKTIF